MAAAAHEWTSSGGCSLEEAWRSGRGGGGVVSIRLGRQLALEERGADMWFPPLHVIHVSKITHHENLMTKYELF